MLVTVYQLNLFKLRKKYTLNKTIFTTYKYEYEYRKHRICLISAITFINCIRSVCSCSNTHRIFMFHMFYMPLSYFTAVPLKYCALRHCLHLEFHSNNCYIPMLTHTLRSIVFISRRNAHYAIFPMHRIA